MPTPFSTDGHALVARLRGETVRVEALDDAVRVRATMNAHLDERAISALLPEARATAAEVELGERGASLSTPALRLDLRLAPRGVHPHLLARVTERATGRVLLEEEAPHFLWPPARAWTAEAGELWRCRQRFRAMDGERFFGMGQHQHGRFDQKGCTIELLQKNTEVVIPLLHSSRGYGLLWNSPGTGRVELGLDATTWMMDAVPQVDWIVIPGPDPAGVLRGYADLTGRPPMMPDWAMGYWQCKLRYRTQDEVLAVAREHRRRGLPLDCLVIDFFHWTAAGEWRFDPGDFPDPSAMVAELRTLRVEPMVSVWPTVSANARTWREMDAAGHLVRSAAGAMDGSIFYDRTPDALNPLFFYDATSPAARAYHWERVRDGYVAHGIRSFWLDACEPEMYPMHPANLRLHAGEGRAAINAYPFEHVRGHAEAAAVEGLADNVLLSRSSWAGAQRFPVLVWSGDVGSTFAELAAQVRAGLNMAMSGVSWWTTDIGGFHGGDVRDPAFHELLIRWFQWGCFCPVMRMHGFRQDAATDARLGHDFAVGGADNEVWSFGPEVEAILARYLHLRARLKPYVAAQMRAAHETGLPPMRPLLVDFPGDPAAWDVSDAHMFGPDLLVAPVLAAGATARDVYLPQGARWRCAWTGAEHEGGRAVTVDAPLARIPLFLRGGARLPIVC